MASAPVHCTGQSLPLTLSLSERLGAVSCLLYLYVWMQFNLYRLAYVDAHVHVHTNLGRRKEVDAFGSLQSHKTQNDIISIDWPCV